MVMVDRPIDADEDIDMSSNDPVIFTRTMARVYAQQGHYDQAVMIYRHLLAESPHDETLIKALADAEAQLAAQQKTQRRDLVHLTRRWIRLLQARKDVERLKKTIP
jgi:hypothetical protein